MALPATRGRLPTATAVAWSLARVIHERKEITMVYRVLPVCLAVLALLLFVSAPALADDVKDLKTHEGKVVSITGNKLVMSANGKEHTHEVAADAKITCDDKKCKLDDLKPGMRIRVSTLKDNAKRALKIEALDKNKTFKD
jgi:hypothetical protein